MVVKNHTGIRRPRCRAIPAGLAVALSLLAVPIGAQEQPAATVPTVLSLQEALAIAKEFNPIYQQQRNDIGVARSQVRAAYGELLPSASAGTGFGYTAAGERRFQSVEFGRQPVYYSSSYDLGISYSLSGSTILQPSVEKSQRRAVERRVVGAESNLDTEVAQQYLTVLQARDQIQQAETQLGRAGEYLRLAQARLEVGAGTPLDVRRAEVEQGRAEVALVQARNQAAIAALQLGQLLGIPLGPDVQLTSEFGIFEPTWQPEDLVDIALRNNPLLLSARASADAASTSVKAARSQYLPSLNFSLGIQGSVYQAGNIDPLVQERVFRTGQQFESCQQSNQLGSLIGRPPQNCARFDIDDPEVVSGIRSEVRSQHDGFPFGYTTQPMRATMGISLPIFTGFSRQLQIDQAKAAREDARHEVRAEELRLRQEINVGLRNLETAYETILLQQRVVANAEEELRMARERFRFGAATSIEVTDAQTNLGQAERDLIEAIYDFHKTLALLEALLGEPLRQPE